MNPHKKMSRYVGFKSNELAERELSSPTVMKRDKIKGETKEFWPDQSIFTFLIIIFTENESHIDRARFQPFLVMLYFRKKRCTQWREPKDSRVNRCKESLLD